MKISGNELLKYFTTYVNPIDPLYEKVNHYLINAICEKTNNVKFANNPNSSFYKSSVYINPKDFEFKLEESLERFIVRISDELNKIEKIVEVSEILLTPIMVSPDDFSLKRGVMIKYQ